MGVAEKWVAEVVGVFEALGTHEGGIFDSGNDLTCFESWRSYGGVDAVFYHGEEFFLADADKPPCVESVVDF